MKLEDPRKECLFNALCLEITADTFSLVYIFCILGSLGLGILSLSPWITGNLIFIIGSLGLITATIPLVFKTHIEKIQGYRDLAVEFKNLSQDLHKAQNKKSLENLKKLRIKLSTYPINSFCKWRVRRKIKKQHII